MIRTIKPISELQQYNPNTNVSWNLSIENEEVVANSISICGDLYLGVNPTKILNIDKLVGGVGLRRGRRDSSNLKPGDAVDFWRVLHANYHSGHLVLYAEMKLPGEAWLEFKLSRKSGVNHLIQKATFRPRGLLGRMYWYALVPIHGILFEGMARRIINYNDPTCKLEI